MGYRYSGYRRNSRLKDIGFKILLGLIAILAVAGAIWGAAEAGGKITTVITHNIGYWIVLFMAIVFGFFRKLTNPDEFSWLELPIQLIVTFVVITGLYALFFTTSANLTDIEIWNGKVTTAEYYEEWTEEVTETYCCAHDKKGNCTSTCTRTYNVHHPPEWSVLTTVGNFSTNKTTYRTYVKHWQNERKKNIMHANQVSFGDGDMFYVSFDGSAEKLITASQEKYYVNYLKASDSIRKISGNISGYKQ